MGLGAEIQGMGCVFGTAAKGMIDAYAFPPQGMGWST
jgi:hypothetical protein